jgi:hypothetical protein
MLPASTVGSTFDEFEVLRRTATQVDIDDGTELWARLGFVARGVVYLIVGALAMQIAWSSSPTTEASKDGALRTVADQPFGEGLLVALAAALAGYALWQFSEALWGHRHELRREKRTMKRLLSAGTGIVYLGVLLTTLRFLLDGTGEGGAGGGRESEESWTAAALDAPGGQVLVGAAAVVLLGVAAWTVHRGLARKYEKRLDTSDMGPVVGRIVDVVGVAGLTARGAVVALLGYLLLRASLDHDPAEAAGVDGALRSLVDEAYGRWIVTVIAVGIACYGLYSWIEARYRRL